MKTILTLAMSLALTTITPASGGGAPEGQPIVVTTLEEMRAHPEAFKTVWVRFPVQFCSIGRVSNPFFTRFVPSDFANFYAWSDRQEIWKRGDYDSVFGMLFLSKESKVLNSLYDLDLYDRVWVTGIVRNVFQGEPWIEATKLEISGGKVNTATLSHLFRGESYMKRREWHRAISELSLAPSDRLPQSVLSSIHRNLGVCYLRLGEAQLAVQHLDQAVSMNAGRDYELKELQSTARDKPETGLDLIVDRSSLQDHERPMWEAFEELGRPPTPAR